MATTAFDAYERDNWRAKAKAHGHDPRRCPRRRRRPQLWAYHRAGAVLTAQTPEMIARIRAEYDRRVGAWLERPTTALPAVGAK